MFHPLLKTQVHTPAELAALIGVSTQTVFVWIRSNKIKSARIGGRFFIPATEFERLEREAQKHLK
jgi:excisionase family DNA binding protein